jgi:hypothetical protein
MINQTGAGSEGLDTSVRMNVSSSSLMSDLSLAVKASCFWFRGNGSFQKAAAGNVLKRKLI